MASTERSLGWATSGTGDGPLAGYDSSRWRANAQKSDGTGITLFGSQMAMSGTTTSTLTIADGACIINGYTYETNGAVTISTTGLTGTYSVVLVANNTAGTVTVTQTGAGGTTIAASTIRAAIATTAQVTTITTAVGAANVITLGSTVIAAGVISTITPVYPFSNSLQLPAQVYAYMDTTGILNVSTGVDTDMAGYSVSATSGEGIMSVSTSTGVITVNVAGVYHVDARCIWDSNTTGVRRIAVIGSGFTYGTMDQQWQSVLPTNLTYGLTAVASGMVFLNAGATVKVSLYQTSGSTRTISNGSFKIVRA
jgi:hypothetical protein